MTSDARKYARAFLSHVSGDFGRDSRYGQDISPVVLPPALNSGAAQYLRSATHLGISGGEARKRGDEALARAHRRDFVGQRRFATRFAAMDTADLESAYDDGYRWGYGGREPAALV
jgi:hypothetical protein